MSNAERFCDDITRQALINAPWVVSVKSIDLEALLRVVRAADGVIQEDKIRNLELTLELSEVVDDLESALNALPGDNDD